VRRLRSTALRLINSTLREGLFVLNKIKLDQEQVQICVLICLKCLLQIPFQEQYPRKISSDKHFEVTFKNSFYTVHKLECVLIVLTVLKMPPSRPTN
jgi:hypothetical protein